MALIQAVLALLSRSLGNVLTAIFGWAVVALFGHTAQREKVALSALVGAAALWPLLLLGVAFPKLAGFLIAFVPLSKNVPGLALRIVWIALAVVVPIALGLVFAARAPARAKHESFVKRVLRGFPLTLGLAGAFVLMLFIAPSLQVVSLVRKRRDEHVPVLVESRAYKAVLTKVVEAFARHGLVLKQMPPPWWVTAPSRLFRKLAGPVAADIVPTQLAYYSSALLDFALYPSEALLRASPFVLAHAHGILSETLAPLDALETSAADAQKLERKLKLVWKILGEAPKARERASVREGLAMRTREAVREIDRTDLSEEDWRTLYREALQLSRALDGEPQLLEAIEVPSSTRIEPERRQ